MDSFLAFAVTAQLFAFVEPPKTGSYSLTFSERSKFSSEADVVRRLGVPSSSRDDYDIEKESFEVYVPKAYTGEKPFGLLVFISPGGQGAVKGFDRDGGWTKALDEREIIWIGPNNAGNNRPAIPRISLALDAAHNAQKRFKIDPERVYVGGVSGGGRITSMTLLPFPEVFTGGYSIIGADLYRNVPSKKGGVYPATYKAPPPKTLALAKKRRFVLLTGDDDANREQMSVIHQILKKDGWRNVFYFQVPGMGHSPPDGEWFAKGLAALDGGPSSTTNEESSEKPARNPPKKSSGKKSSPP